MNHVDELHPVSRQETRILEKNWSQTPVGSASTWPPSLSTALSIGLNSRFPIIIFWGTELVQFYNDAYAPILGARHPNALGQRAQECWPEIWHQVGPMLRGVLHDGKATWSEDLLLNSNAMDFLKSVTLLFRIAPLKTKRGLSACFVR